MTDFRTLDSIVLTGIRVYANHGVFDFERQNGQTFVIDATVWLDAAEAARSDELERTVHYGELATALAEATERDPVDLIETLAERLAEVALSYDRVRAAEITVHKPEAPIDLEFADVAVRILRVKR